MPCQRWSLLSNSTIQIPDGISIQKYTAGAVIFIRPSGKNIIGNPNGITSKKKNENRIKLSPLASKFLRNERSPHSSGLVFSSCSPCFWTGTYPKPQSMGRCVRRGASLNQFGLVKNSLAESWGEVTGKRKGRSGEDW